MMLKVLLLGFENASQETQSLEKISNYDELTVSSDLAIPTLEFDPL